MIENAYEVVSELHCLRYRVERVPRTWFRYQVLIGTSTWPTYEGSKRQCEEIAAMLRTAFLDGAYVTAKLK